MSGKDRPLPSDLDEEVSAWLLAHDRGLSADDERAFDDWLARSPTNGRAWAEAADLWIALGDAEEDPGLSRMLDNARDAEPAPSTWRRPLQAGFAAAAVVVAGAAAWMGMVPDRSGPAPAGQTVAAQHFSTGYRTASFSLRDGSRLVLDAGSSASFTQRDGNRIAVLERGRAYFAVLHDPAKPFRVQAGAISVLDVGTEFTVANEVGAQSVVLLSGKVEVRQASDPSHAVALEPGQAFKRRADGTSAVTSTDGGAAASWRSGVIELRDVSIADALAQMNRYSAVHVEVGDAKVGAMRISGRFRTGDARRFAQLLSISYPVRLVEGRGGKPVLRFRN